MYIKNIKMLKQLFSRVQSFSSETDSNNWIYPNFYVKRKKIWNQFMIFH